MLAGGEVREDPRALGDPPVRGALDDRLWMRSVADLTPKGRRLVLVLATLLTMAWAWLPNGDLHNAWDLPDVMHYVHMAQGRFDLVPAPFSARPLAPLLARGLAGVAHAPVTAGFAALAGLCVLGAAGVVLWLALRSGAPRWMLVMVAAVPFWPQLLGDAGLPDALYTALLAGLLLCLEQDWLLPAAGLMLPLMLTRESTTLTLLCLLLVGWRQLRWQGVLVAVASAAVGAAVVRHLDAGSLPNPEHMSGGLYLFGKVMANTVRSTGVLPWSNVYPMLCGTPAWQHTLHLGPVRSVGVCAYSPETVEQALLGLLTTFGLLPMLLLLGLPLRLRKGRRWRDFWGTSLLLRFCLLYGGVSFAMAPTLGTWYERLFGYGWPLLLVAVPRLLGSTDGNAGALSTQEAGMAPTGGSRGPGMDLRWMLVVVLQMVVGVLALREVYRGVPAWTAGCEAAGAALLLVQWQRWQQARLQG